MDRRNFLRATVGSVVGGIPNQKLLASREKTLVLPPNNAHESPESSNANAASETVLTFEDFTKKIGKWASSEGVTTKNIADGHIWLVNKHTKPPRPPSVPTSLTYEVFYTGDITTEVKFDDFVPNYNSTFQIQLMSPRPGYTLTLGRWSENRSKMQFIQFQVFAASGLKIKTSVTYSKNTGVLKVQYIVKPRQLRAFYKDGPGAQYKEMPGSPYVLPSFEGDFPEGPYKVVVYAFNCCAPGGPASVKLDWVKITGRKGKVPNFADLGGPEQPRRSKNFKPFHFRYSTEDLLQQFSDRITERATKEMERVDHINQIGPYHPTWESLDSHPLPEWFEDAKFGMFIDWGLYSIPAYAPTGYPDWYLWRMIYGYGTRLYHDEVWGKDFTRDDFIPLFTASDYNPELLARAAVSAGMRYVIPFCKHHDGFCLWPSSYTFRNAAEMGPKRDLIEPLAQACRARNLKFGFYFSLDEWEYPIVRGDGKLVVRMWNTIPIDVHVVPYSQKKFNGLITGKVPVRRFYSDYIDPQAIEFIDRYDPDVIWFDGDWVTGAAEQQRLRRDSKRIVAYFYNHAQGRKEVVVNDREGVCRKIPTMGEKVSAKPHGDFWTSEGLYAPGKDPGYQHIWEENMGLSHSFGYNWRKTSNMVKSPHELIQMLVEVVASGGNLLLITNLTGTGKLDPVLVERLGEIGPWLGVNGEAIYATRRWIYFKQGESIRFTQSKDGKYAYAISLKWPGTSLFVRSVVAKRGSSVTMLGVKDPLVWHQNDNGLTVEIPEKLAAHKPCNFAWAFKIELQTA